MGALCLLALVRGLLWDVSLPPWYGPDEPAHFAYVQLLATEGRVPRSGDLADWSASFAPEIQCSTHNLGYRSNAQFYTQPVWGRDPAPCRQPTDPAGRLPADPINMAADYTPLFYALGVPFWAAASSAPVEVRLQAVRMLSVLLGVAATAFAYLAAAWTFPGRPWRAVGAALIFTFQPSLAQQTSFVTNDALLVALAAAFAWVLMRAFRRPPDWRWWALLGGLGGLSYLAKPQGAFLLAAVPLLALAQLASSVSWRRLAVPSAAAVVVAAVFGGLGLAGQLFWHGTLSPHAVVKPGPAPHGLTQWIHAYTDRNLNHLYWQFVVSAWGDLSWFSASVPAWIFAAAGIAYLLALVGLAAGLASGRLEPAPTLLAAASAVLISAGILGLEALYFRSNGILILQGRSFLEAMPFFAILLAAGMGALAPRRWEPAACGVVAVLALGANLASVMVLWDSFYG